MKAVFALLFVMVATSQAAKVLLHSAPYAPLPYAHPAPLTYAHPAPLTYAHPAPLTYAHPAPLTYAHAAPVVYSAPKVTNVEVPTPVVTKTNLHVLTDSDKISTTEIKPFGFNYGYAGYPHFAY